MNNILIVAPHPDDEVLGVGGTIARLSKEGNNVYVVIVTKGQPPMFDEALIEQSRQEAREAHQLLGVSDTIFLDGFPAAGLDTVPHHKLNEAIKDIIAKVKPSILFVAFYGDIHLDHRLVFESTLVAARPNGENCIKAIYAYETLSETNWNAPFITPGFLPNVYFDINDFLDMKLKAMKVYRSKLKFFPHERSIEAIDALARMRGATVGLRAAEAFVLVRSIC
jgi:LmbE family N-acetylglucosaminyl deacetylase